MKNKLMKTLMVAGLALTAIFTITLTSVDAKSVYDDYALESYSETFVIEEGYTLEEMLTYAILDEYMAQAEYQAIIETFGNIMPFVRIVEAEQTHIDMLLPLFETYGIAVPENQAASNVVIPDSITSALATGVEAEEKNIAMYEAFLAQEDLPSDVRDVFEYLKNASEHHLQAFSKDRYNYYGEDMMNQIKNQWRKAFGEGSAQGDQHQYRGARGSQGQVGYGECQLND